MKQVFSPLQVWSYHSLLHSTLSPKMIIHIAKKRHAKHAVLTDILSTAGSIEFYHHCKQNAIIPIIGTTLYCPKYQCTLLLIAQSHHGYQNINICITDCKQRPTHPLNRMLNQWDLTDTIVITTNPTWFKLIKARNGTPYLGVLPYQLGKTHTDSSRIVPLFPIAHAHKKDQELSGILKAIRTKKRYESSPPLPCMNDIESILNTYPQHYITNTLTLLESCHLQFPPCTWQSFQIPFCKNPSAWLSKICHEKCPDHPPYKTRLQKELNIIKKMKFCGYFVIVSDIILYTKSQAIPTLGRGSAANSLVSYLLDITEIDPIEEDLYFERFLNPKRRTAPDIDLDICWKNRHAVIQYIQTRYPHTSMIGSITHFSLRSAFRDVGRCMGLSDSELSTLTRNIPQHTPTQTEENTLITQLSQHLNNPLYRQITTLAQELTGLPRHTSVHPGGILITPNPITTYSAQTPSKIGPLVTQLDMHSIEYLGLIKIDILGQRSLSVYNDTLADLNHPPLKLKQILHDSATYQTLQKGETIGCFYVESPAMRQLLQKLKPKTFNDIVAATSIIRPGVAQSGMMKAYISAHQSPNPPPFLHPALKPILSRTYGIMIYQEDVLKVAHKVAGLSLSEADLLRCAMSGKTRSKQAFKQLEIRFKTGLKKNGFSPTQTETLWHQLYSFSGYSFCKAHSASYSTLAYKAAYLKTHHPAAFMAAVLSNHGGFYSTQTYIDEAKRLGITLQLPCINKSHLNNTAPSKHTIQIGLLQITEIATRTLQKIYTSQKTQTFTSLINLIHRTGITAKECEHLIRATSCRSLNHSRPCLLRQMDQIYQKRPTPQLPLIPTIQIIPTTSCFKLPDFPKKTHAKYIHQTLKLALYNTLDPFRNRNDKPISQIQSSPNQNPIQCIGRIIAKRRIPKHHMAFLSLADETSTIEARITGRAYHTYQSLFHIPRLMRIKGHIHETKGLKLIQIYKLEHLHIST